MLADGRLEVLEAWSRARLGARQSVDLATRYGGRPAFAAAALFFLLDYRQEQPQGSAQPFVAEVLERLVHQLSRSSQPVQRVYPGQVRGRVLWSATYKQRYTDQYDPTLFVCREVRRRYDLPENQLVKYLIDVLEACLDAVPPYLRNGRCLLPPGVDSALPGGLDTGQRLAQIDAVLRRIQRSAVLREVSLPETITPTHLLKARTSRMEEYALAAVLYDGYYQIAVQRSWETLRMAVRRIVPLPANLDADGQKWIDLLAALGG